MTIHERPFFLVDGIEIDRVPVDDRGFQYGDGVFETMRMVMGRIPFLSHHWQRLMDSCDQLGLPCDGAIIRYRLEQLLTLCRERKLDEGIVKLTVTRGSGGRGYSSVGCRGRVVVAWYAAQPLKDQRALEGVAVMNCQTRLGHSPALAGLKHLNRLEQVLARREVDGTACSEGFLQDVNGFVIEGTMANLFLIESGTVVTPDLTRCGVAGVFRQWLLHDSSYAGVVTIMNISVRRLLAADEVFIGNSVIGAVPVIRCGERTWQLGPVTRKVQQEVWQLFHV